MFDASLSFFVVSASIGRSACACISASTSSLISRGVGVRGPLLSMTLSTDERITNSEGADFDSSSGRVVLGNSHGFVGEYRSSSYSLAVSPVAVDPDSGAMQRDAWYEVQRKYHKLSTPESIGIEAAHRAVRRLGARKVDTTRVPIVFDQETAGSLLGNLCSAASGYSLYKGASFLAGQL